MSAPIGTGDGFQVDPDGLAAHARVMTALADRVRQAGAKALPVPTEAYGVIGQAFAGAATNAAGTAILAVSLLAEVNEDAAADLDATRIEYERAERAAVAEFERIHC